MPESKRRKPKKPKQSPPARIVIKRGKRYLRMRDETGRRVWTPLPDQTKDEEAT